MQDERQIFSHCPHRTQRLLSMTGRNRLKRLTVPSKVPTGHKVLQYQRPYRQASTDSVRKYAPASTAAGTTRGRISTFDIIGSQPDERPARPFHAYDAGMASICDDTAKDTVWIYESWNQGYAQQQGYGHCSQDTIPDPPLLSMISKFPAIFFAPFCQPVYGILPDSQRTDHTTVQPATKKGNNKNESNDENIGSQQGRQELQPWKEGSCQPAKGQQNRRHRQPRQEYTAFVQHLYHDLSRIPAELLYHIINGPDIPGNGNMLGAP